MSKQEEELRAQMEDFSVRVTRFDSKFIKLQIKFNHYVHKKINLLLRLKSKQMIA